MFCSKCGKENPDTSKYCGFCGTPLMGKRIAKNSLDYGVIYLVFMIISNVLLLFSGMFPILSVYSSYDYREHECGFFRHLFSNGYLEYQIGEMNNKYCEMEYKLYSYVTEYFKEEYLPSLFCCVFMIASLVFVVLSIFFSLLFIYKLVMGNRGLSLVKVSSATLVCGTIYLSCLMLYTYIPFLGDQDCTVTTLGIVLLVYTIITMVFVQREYLKKCDELASSGPKGIVNSTVFITLSVMIFISFVGVIIGINIARYQFATPLYSEEYGWKIEGHWAYYGEEQFPSIEVYIEKNDEKFHIEVVDWDEELLLYDKEIEFDEMNEYVIDINSGREDMYQSLNNEDIKVFGSGDTYVLHITPRKMWISTRGSEMKYELQ